MPCFGLLYTIFYFFSFWLKKLKVMDGVLSFGLSPVHQFAWCNQCIILSDGSCVSSLVELVELHSSKFFSHVHLKSNLIGLIVNSRFGSYLIECYILFVFD